MSTAVSFPVKVLNDELKLRKTRNSSYSLRSFANFLGINSATLSSVLKNKRSLPLNKILDIAKKLNLKNKEKALFVNCSSDGKIKLNNITIKEDEIKRSLIDDKTHFDIIAEWEYYALLTLIEVDDFQSCVQWIADSLNISIKRTEEVISNLLLSKLLIKDAKGNFYQSTANLETPDDIASKALRASHKEAMDIGKKKIDELDIFLRDFSSITFSGDLSKLNEAKVLIRDFQDKLELLLGDEKAIKSNVLQCNVQLFPVSGC